MQEEKLTIKRVGIVLRPSTPELKVLFFQVKRVFERYGTEVLIDSISAGMIGVLGQDFDSMCEASDILVCIGGDGTLISLVRRSYKYHKPVFGINVGKLGFLVDIKPSEIESFVEKLYKNEIRIDERMMIKGVLKRDNLDKIFYSFNDIVISRRVVSKMVKVDAFIENKWFNTYYGDGLIVSTPTGSTAYNLASGGPVTFPMTDAFILTPICPHSLTQPPLVMPTNFKIDIKVEHDDSLIVVDGQDEFEIDKKTTLVVQKAEVGAKLIYRKERSYFDVLRDKFSWGQCR